MEAGHKQEVQELNRTVQELHQRSKELKSSIESQQTNMGFEKDRVSNDSLRPTMRHSFNYMYMGTSKAMSMDIGQTRQ